jgi:hypothetical protein
MKVNMPLDKNFPKKEINRTISRRDFLKLIPPVALAGLLSSRNIENVIAAPKKPILNLKGIDLAGWTVDLGDALYARPVEEAPVDISDIETVRLRRYSELRANINRRVIMAHNITYKRIIDNDLLNYKHTCSYQLKMPYLPLPDVSAPWNAQTIEGGIFVWDGANTQRDYGTAFQWELNPWGDFGAVKIWTTDINGVGQWITAGNMTPDTKWHNVKMIVDIPSGTAGLLIDNTPYPAYFSATAKTGWGTEVAARLQAEIVSIYPEPSGIQAAHKAQFRNWRWYGRYVL